MEEARRRFLRSGGGIIGMLVAVGFLSPAQLRAAQWDQAAFEARDIDQLVRVLGGRDAAPSADIELLAPDIAENGAVVPIGVVSRLPGTQSIAIVVEKNPGPLAALFTLPPGTMPDLQTRVKMAETCNVFALVKTVDGFRYAKKEIKVTLGGCGG